MGGREKKSSQREKFPPRDDEIFFPDDFSIITYSPFSPTMRKIDLNSRVKEISSSLSLEIGKATFFFHSMMTTLIIFESDFFCHRPSPEKESRRKVSGLFGKQPTDRPSAGI